MAETYTSNLGLVKPDYDSPADISVINSNMDKIDNAVANAGKVKSVNGKTGDVVIDDVSKLNGKGAEFYATDEAVDQLSQQISDEWAAGKSYAKGDFCIDGNTLYKCKTAHTAGQTFNETYWQKTNVTQELHPIYSKIIVGTSDAEGDLATFLGRTEFIVVGAICLREYGNETYSNFFTAMPNGMLAGQTWGFKLVTDGMEKLANQKVAVQVFYVKNENTISV